MVCKDSNHSPFCPSHNSLKGASLVSTRTVNQQQPNKQLIFSPEDISFLVKSLLLCRKFVTKNQAQYQQQNTKDILNELSTSINILSTRKNNQNQHSKKLKGASNINSFQVLDNIRKMVGLT